MSREPFERDHVAPRRVLVVDDFIDLADAVRLLLQRHGHVVMMSCDARSALDVVETFAPELVLLDIGARDQHGHALVEELRQRLGARGARLVAVSGWGRDAHVARADEPGRNDLLIESAELGVLLELIATSSYHADVGGG